MQNLILEIDCFGETYQTLGHCCLQIQNHWPYSGDFDSFIREEPSIKICVLGVLFMYYNEDNNFFKENYNGNIYKVINENYTLFDELLHKWFEKGGEGISPKLFIDFVYTITEHPINKYDAANGEDLIFESGSKIVFKNKNHSWDEICDEYFVPVNSYQEVIEDIAKLETLFTNSL
jgi:hypothetical protein